MAIVAPGARALVVLAVVAVFCVCFCAGTLQLVRRPQFWLLVASALLLSPLFIGEKDAVLWGLRVSREGFWLGLWMTVRALSIALAFNGYANVISVAELAALFEKAGPKGLGFAMGVALNMLPSIQETIGSTVTAMRLRGGFRRDRLGTLKKLFVTVVAVSLRRGEEIVDSAEARAFDPARPQGGLALATRADFYLAASLLLCGLAIILI
jgi:energy-coupling factor transporter transmembrane protein EcfT